MTYVWESFEDWLETVDDGEEFVPCAIESYPLSFQHEHDGIRSYADEYGLDNWQASYELQAYLREQRKRPRKNKEGKIIGGSLSSYHIHRQVGTRTRTAVWGKGTRAKDSRAIGRAYHNDTVRKAVRAFEPDLLRLADQNPQAARRARRQIKMTLDGAMTILEAAVEG